MQLGKGEFADDARINIRAFRLAFSLWTVPDVCTLVSELFAQSVEEMMGVKEGHCSLAQATVDGETFACMVWDHDSARFSGDPNRDIPWPQADIHDCARESNTRVAFLAGRQRTCRLLRDQTGLGNYALYEWRQESRLITCRVATTSQVAAVD